MTKHAQVRSQQRCIPPLVQDLLRNFGSEYHCGSGCVKLIFDKPARKRVKAYAGSLASKLNEHLDAYLVVGSCETTVTVGHLTERVRRH